MSKLVVPPMAVILLGTERGMQKSRRSLVFYPVVIIDHSTTPSTISVREDADRPSESDEELEYMEHLDVMDML
jgi:hypothetical protein